VTTCVHTLPSHVQVSERTPVSLRPPNSTCSPFSELIAEGPGHFRELDCMRRLAGRRNGGMVYFGQRTTPRRAST